ncbi:hypothetical protein TRP8649_01240 [Pelagimonas phthalicica]|uniref:PD-(D/E)XK nuclease superfamily protein n=1 Tax=Pelagimonas phthalicica TaxID=1037362 RepID=A0A238J8Z8_9RHOB|nr:PD-(D/E)XK nuclease family protein [Pelagimonas phthalicica]TDS94335.1 PD-(D/E)XK nuclease superfamily protein [Pelagimonas phthalicica]SMX27138.1 hypothetical protein TRP8649_01240 [Pelagimonas phthalicica]
MSDFMMLEKLSQLVLSSPEFVKIEREMHQFCPFEAIGMARQEIRHSHFLSYILDPSRPHGLGDTALRALLKALPFALPSESLRFHFLPLSSANVWRERERIDILIEIPNQGGKGAVIAIEVKVDASERQNQLKDYAQRITSIYPAESWHHLFCFLSPDGREGETQGDQEWKSLSFQDLLNEIDQALLRENIIGDGAELFGHYKNMMKRHGLVHETGEQDDLDQAVQMIWSKHKEALDYLIANRPDPLNDVLEAMEEQKDAFAQRLGGDIRIVADETFRRYRRFSFPDLMDEYPALRKGDKNWISSASQLVLEVTAENEEIVASFAVGPIGEDVEFRLQLISAMNEAFAERKKPTTRVHHYKRGGILTWEELHGCENRLGELKTKLKAFVLDHYDLVAAAVNQAAKAQPAS